jgi:hypothetical protein
MRFAASPPSKELVTGVAQLPELKLTGADTRVELATLKGDTLAQLDEYVDS